MIPFKMGLQYVVLARLIRNADSTSLTVVNLLCGDCHQTNVPEDEELWYGVLSNCI